MHIARLRNGAILISVGVVLLLNTTGHLPWMVWGRILSLWPIALVAIGIELLFKKTRLSLLAILSPLLFLAAILGPAFIFKPDFGKIHRTGEAYLWSQDLDSTLTKATATLKLMAGELRLSSGTDKLISTELGYCDNQPLTAYRYISSDSSASIEIKDTERTGKHGWSFDQTWFGRDECEKNWDIKLTDRIPLILKVDTKAAKADFDLSGLKVEEFDLEAQASKVDLKIGSLLNEVSCRIDAKAAKLSISFPEDLGLRIENHAKMSTTSFSHLSLKEIEDGYETPDFEKAPRKLILYLEGSVIKLKINQYASVKGI